MSNQSSTQQKLSECRICRDAGFPGQMIGFVKTSKTKPDGKPIWSLHNIDMTSHYHKSPLDKLPQIEVTKEKPPQRPPMQDSEIEELKKRVLRLERVIEAMVNGYQQQTS